MKRLACCISLCAVLLLSATDVTFAQLYDVYKPGQMYVADVDKPNPADNSCWLASAANLLGSAGWGNEITIYNSMTGHFVNGAGVVMPGWSSLAINWWLMEHGLNPGSPDYRPNPIEPYPGAGTYTDVTIMNQRLTNTDYDFLLDELTACQLVNVSFDIPNQTVGHEMTLVGGNYSPLRVPANPIQVSVWHDNQGDLTPPGGDDDDYNNVWFNGNFWNIDRLGTPGQPNDDWEADGATLLCPGLMKPEEAMGNFDVAWYMDMNVNGTLVPNMRTAGAKYGIYRDPNQLVDPSWDVTDANAPVLLLPNEEMPDPWYKEIWLLVDFVDRGHSGELGIVVDANGVSYDPASTQWSDDGGQALVYWQLPDQPGWEEIVFPSDDYYNLYKISGGSDSLIKDWNLATFCVPEPTILALLAAGALALLRRRH